MTDAKPTITAAEWKLIRAGVANKLAAVKSGMYGQDLTTKEWQVHLESILEAKPEDLGNDDWLEVYYAVENDEELVEKIGPDAENMQD